MSEYIPTEAAAQGAVRLDDVRPTWFKDINLDKLDLADPDKCILGQLWGWLDGVFEVDCANNREKQNAWGFDIPEHLYRHAVDMDTMFALLTVAWKDEIKKRLVH